MHHYWGWLGMSLFAPGKTNKRLSMATNSGISNNNNNIHNDNLSLSLYSFFSFSAELETRQSEDCEKILMLESQASERENLLQQALDTDKEFRFRRDELAKSERH